MSPSSALPPARPGIRPAGEGQPLAEPEWPGLGLSEVQAGGLAHVGLAGHLD